MAGAPDPLQTLATVNCCITKGSSALDVGGLGGRSGLVLLTQSLASVDPEQPPAMQRSSNVFSGHREGDDGNIRLHHRPYIAEQE
jgi:hypothetical protein